MNVAIRARRILTALTNYQRTEFEEDRACHPSVERLGAEIGCYTNPGVQGARVGIYSNGLGWLDGCRMVSVLFSEINEVTLLNGKQSEGLLLKIRDGQQLRLPIEGRKGQFLDSLEMLRFLDRVIHDLGDKGSE